MFHQLSLLFTNRTFLLVAHLVGMTLYLGGTFFLHLLVAHTIKNGSVENAHVRIFAFMNQFIIAGATVIGLSGFGMLAVDSNSEKKADAHFLLQEPRIIIKIAIFFAIGFLGKTIHEKYITPLMEKNIGKRITTETDLWKKIPFIWTINSSLIILTFAPVVLGRWRDLNKLYGYEEHAYIVITGAFIGIAALLFALSFFQGKRVQKKLGR